MLAMPHSVSSPSLFFRSAQDHCSKLVSISVDLSSPPLPRAYITYLQVRRLELALLKRWLRKGLKPVETLAQLQPPIFSRSEEMAEMFDGSTTENSCLDFADKKRGPHNANTKSSQHCQIT